MTICDDLGLRNTIGIRTWPVESAPPSDEYFIAALFVPTRRLLLKFLTGLFFECCHFLFGQKDISFEGYSFFRILLGEVFLFGLIEVGQCSPFVVIGGE